MNIKHTKTTVETIITRELTVEDGPIHKTKLHAYTGGYFKVESITITQREGSEPHLVLIEGPACDAVGQLDPGTRRNVREIKREALDSDTYRWLKDII
ncbi:hypothetical protein SONNY_53 [Arthrobacter phage Sonny]|uniref:Uncharacterized protein n=1 Tax=Arthrobacter phage Sonny TaxID=1772315 RepID=A0A0U4JPQ4_9CAUD|nr:hypothetical protein FDH50_gp53 [Arthrobacter phage Sonny]ALY10321.1 hypothetical protein SONNY_53 [Arthrobacter phage Sonny]